MRDLEKIKEKVIIELDNHQLGLALLGFVLVSVGTFAAGVLVGQRMTSELPNPLDSSLDQIAAVNAGQARTAQLTRLVPGTRELDKELSQEATAPRPDSPTEAARMEAHRQLANASATAAAESSSARALGPIPIAPPEAPAPAAKAVTLVERNPALEQAALDAPAPQLDTKYALEVSAFRSPEPAKVVANQLESAGHDVRVRELPGDNGGKVWRVEVGDFEDTRTAGVFQRQFEQTAGYPTVMVSVR